MILGLDYASVDHASPEFPALYQEGYRFAILRKSYGWWDSGHRAWHLAPDTVYARDAQAARDAGLIVGSYLFPSFAKNAPSAEEQVANFVKAGNVQRGKDLPPCIDVEFPGKNGQPDTGRTKGECLDFLKELMTEMLGAYGVYPMIYTSHVQWHDDNGLGGPSAPWISRCPLWVKVPYRLRAGNLPDDHVPAAPVLPLPWQRSGWWIRQGQGDAKVGHMGQADLNDFNVFDPLAPGADARYDWVATAVGWGTSCPAPQALSDTIKSFQVLNHLVDDGIVGPATFAALYWNQ